MSLKQIYEKERERDQETVQLELEISQPDVLQIPHQNKDKSWPVTEGGQQPLWSCYAASCS